MTRSLIVSHSLEYPSFHLFSNAYPVRGLEPILASSDEVGGHTGPGPGQVEPINQ